MISVPAAGAAVSGLVRTSEVPVQLDTRTAVLPTKMLPETEAQVVTLMGLVKEPTPVLPGATTATTAPPLPSGVTRARP
ncbi:MAG: hypothetical protein C4321_05340, partial [Chloroflexota bacterium]